MSYNVEKTKNKIGEIKKNIEAKNSELSNLEKNKQELLDLMTRVGRIQIYIIGLLCIGFICVGREFIQLWLGEGYEEVYPCALMIILPSFLQLPQEIGNTSVVAAGKVKQQAYAFMLMAAMNLLLAYPMTKYWGVEGLCCSIMIAYLVRTLTMDYIFYKHIQINVFKFFRDSYLRILPSIALSIVLSLVLFEFLENSGWYGFILKTLLCVLIYLLSIWVFAMNNYEKHLFASPMNRILKR